MPVERSRVQLRHDAPTGQGRDPNIAETIYIHNGAWSKLITCSKTTGDEPNTHVNNDVLSFTKSQERGPIIFEAPYFVHIQNRCIVTIA